MQCSGYFWMKWSFPKANGTIFCDDFRDATAQWGVFAKCVRSYGYGETPRRSFRSEVSLLIGDTKARQRRPVAKDCSPLICARKSPRGNFPANGWKEAVVIWYSLTTQAYKKQSRAKSTLRGTCRQKQTQLHVENMSLIKSPAFNVACLPVHQDSNKGVCDQSAGRQTSEATKSLLPFMSQSPCSSLRPQFVRKQFFGIKTEINLNEA